MPCRCSLGGRGARSIGVSAADTVLCVVLSPRSVCTTSCREYGSLLIRCQAEAWERRWERKTFFHGSQTTVSLHGSFVELYTLAVAERQAYPTFVCRDNTVLYFMNISSRKRLKVAS